MTIKKIAIVGLGYVGLPLAVTFATKIPTIGFDINEKAIASYCNNIDINDEVTKDGFAAAKHITYTSDETLLKEADVIIIAVPTPIGGAWQPDLRPLQGASRTVGRNLKKGAIVVYESTVFPGTTEEVCIPILEEESGGTWKKDFFVGYSPERINPGDKEHTLTKILKIVSGDTDETLKQLVDLYEMIIEAGICQVSSLKVAEAAKVIENTQRDLNIALMNELALIFDKLNIDTLDVLEAAGTKWNFLPFRPGLVGGHCIGVDPYYLTYKAESVGYHPDVILAGRTINDNMGKFIAEKTVKLVLKSGLPILGGKIGILGLTFKENCPDLRNSKVGDIIDELQDFGVDVLVHDPRALPQDCMNFFNIELSALSKMKDLSALIIAVPHKEYKTKDLRVFTDMLCPNGCIIDVKSLLNVKEITKTGINFWRL